jgi:hypothetical protein
MYCVCNVITLVLNVMLHNIDDTLSDIIGNFPEFTRFLPLQVSA